ncbi:MULTISPECIES: alanine--tRNA ligase [Anaerococcus]|uniref:Alanine--tRNA ligase n=1 Tax=Anaerococcus nagyae TaxID=1755241 RepID=A0A3E2TIP6_9FIRM|nr:MULTISPECIES: alanine--tRNA ligase [Anaerococcus]MBP2069730.1 alanyl-tRNA synthetase [Anaerococcus nagyae]MDU3211301.1 alanine--tRNA ligase [Anaerococcus sp.]RGB76552.1 alanine--tRNA ligase [Anaerococcus nagyae]
MKNLGMNELRKSYIDFFGNEKNHTILKSFPLIPQDDESLLLINAGMAPLKKYFIGEKKIKNNRATSSQRCVRTGDIERVGKTERHGTYFEMLGNFSFGDYFKKEAITWAYEFLTDRLQIDKEDIWVTVFHEDDEAYNIWHEQVGLSTDRILKQGKEDNFWELEVGPCGPCSEIFVDRGQSRAIDENDNQPGNDDSDRFLEVWNLVFTQFNKDKENNYTPLAHPNIDTGMGLERIAMVVQNKDNIFEIDVMQDIISEIEKVSGVKYKNNPKTDISIRVIADHAKAMTFLISDGIIPSNEKRGYVLRRLIRRAYRHGKLLGIKGEFLSQIVEKVIDTYKSEYEELVFNKENIINAIVDEEERFQNTIDQGLDRLNSLIDEMKENGEKELSGSEAFKLYDTYGFPLDLTKEILNEENFDVDINKFNEEMENQRELARNARKKDSGWSLDNIVTDGISPTEFVGYDDLEVKAKIISIFDDSENKKSIDASDKGIIVSDKTSFYAQGGGQVSDTGYILSENTKACVTDVQKKNDIYFHYVEVIEGSLQLNNEYLFKVDRNRRLDITRNHSATHLLDQALRDVLKDTVKQAGSLVDEDKLRFDFTYNEALTKEQKREIEDIINEKIREELPVRKNIVSFKESQEIGAIGLFEDKYKDNVRVVSIGEYSKELCGGCHVNNSSNILMFKIISESSVSAGVRRIEAVTGKKVYDLLVNQKNIIDDTAQFLNTRPNQIKQRIESLEEEIQNQKEEIKRLRSSSIKDIYKDLESNIVKKDDHNSVVYKFKNTSIGELRDYENRLKNSYDNLIIVFASVSDEKIVFTVSVDDNLTDKYNAGNIVREISQITGGNGGGRRNFAQAGGKDISKLDSALEKAFEII